ncbi:MAG: hypothetical protein NVS1B14_08950 [Vulcanimicrobiaceae bacterium]
MIPADLAFARYVNETAAAYAAHAPTYLSYRERTHVEVSGSAHGRQDINRQVWVRVADNFAVMQDLPQGALRTGQAFPIIPYFNPLSDFGFEYYVNLRRRDISIERAASYVFALPKPDPAADAVVYYNPYFRPRYASDSTDAAPHFHIDLVYSKLTHYVSDLQIDPNTHLPSHVVVTFSFPMTATFDYHVIDKHWIITHATIDSHQGLGPLQFHVVAETSYDQFLFPEAPPDSRLR